LLPLTTVTRRKLARSDEISVWSAK
jgi:hypothetical protein